MASVGINPKASRLEENDKFLIKSYDKPNHLPNLSKFWIGIACKPEDILNAIQNIFTFSKPLLILRKMLITFISSKSAKQLLKWFHAHMWIISKHAVRSALKSIFVSRFFTLSCAKAWQSGSQVPAEHHFSFTCNMPNKISWDLQSELRFVQNFIFCGTDIQAEIVVLFTIVAAAEHNMTGPRCGSIQNRHSVKASMYLTKTYDKPCWDVPM